MGIVRDAGTEHLKGCLTGKKYKPEKILVGSIKYNGIDGH